MLISKRHAAPPAYCSPDRIPQWRPKPDRPDAIAALVADAEAKIKSGELNVYEGPLNDNDGNEVVAAGAVIDSLGSYAVDFAVEGVSGI